MSAAFDPNSTYTAPGDLVDPAAPPNCIIDRNGIEALDELAATTTVGLIAVDQSDIRSFSDDIYKRGFGSIHIDAQIWEEGGSREERVYLLIGNNPDSGNLKGFLRQYGALYRQRYVIYKSSDDPDGYLLGGREGKSDKLCLGPFRACRLPVYIGLLLEQIPTQIEALRFSLQKTLHNRSGVWPRPKQAMSSCLHSRF